MEMRNESKRPNRWSIVKKAFAFGLTTCFALLFAVYLWACFSIRSSVSEITAMAVREYPGDKIEALMTYVDSPNHSLRQRNRAVWALGQIGDARALPVLEKFRTGKPCDHDATLCQREVEKAIEACNGAFNATAWLPK